MSRLASETAGHERVKAIAERVGGKVIELRRDTLRVDIPADTAPEIATLWAQDGVT